MKRNYIISSEKLNYLLYTNLSGKSNIEPIFVLFYERFRQTSELNFIISKNKLHHKYKANLNINHSTFTTEIYNFGMHQVHTHIINIPKM